MVNLKSTFPLTMKDLLPGYLYHCDNGTVVIVASDNKLKDNFVFNIENGIGCYSNQRFRKFKTNEIHITSDENSEMFVEFA